MTSERIDPVPFRRSIDVRIPSTILTYIEECLYLCKYCRRTTERVGTNVFPYFRGISHCFYCTSKLSLFLSTLTNSLL